MIDKTRNEALSIEHGAICAGEVANEAVAHYGSDFANWPPEAWHAMIEAAITGFVENMQRLKGSE